MWFTRSHLNWSEPFHPSAWVGERGRPTTDTGRAHRASPGCSDAVLDARGGRRPSPPTTAEPAPATVLQNEDIGQVGERRPIGHDRCQANLFLLARDAKAERMPYRPLNHLPRHPCRPVGVGQEAIPHGEVEFLDRGPDPIVTSSPLVDRALTPAAASPEDAGAGGRASPGRQLRVSHRSPRWPGIATNRHRGAPSAEPRCHRRPALPVATRSHFAARW